MNEYLRSYLHRGLIFGGFGPIIVGTVYLILTLTGVSVEFDGTDAFIGILSTYLLAFVQAGASVFNQIESWPLAKSLFFHLSSIYLAYVFTYLVNSWIPFEPIVLIIFTAVFVLTYFAIWLTVYFVTRAVTRKMNERLAVRESNTQALRR